MLSKEQLSVMIRTKAEEIVQHVLPPRGEWDSFVLELKVGELSTMVKCYREMPHTR